MWQSVSLDIGMCELEMALAFYGLPTGRSRDAAPPVLGA
jgi:hypothetical protein